MSCPVLTTVSVCSGDAYCLMVKMGDALPESPNTVEGGLGYPTGDNEREENIRTHNDVVVTLGDVGHGEGDLAGRDGEASGERGRCICGQ